MKPNGRVAISDMALIQPIPAGVKKIADALGGCVSGAALISDTEGWLKQVGLEQVELIRNSNILRVILDFKNQNIELREGINVGDYITSLEIKAKKIVK